MNTAGYWIKSLKMEKHPEGGYFKEVYRSHEYYPPSHLPERFSGERCFATSIYFLLEAGSPSKMHRIKSDEIWHFYTGAPVQIFVLNEEDKTSTKHCLGPDLANGEHLQQVVSQGQWFGAEVCAEVGYSLVGCTVAPGFDFQDFEMAKRSDLLKKFPDRQELIYRLT